MKARQPTKQQRKAMRRAAIQQKQDEKTELGRPPSQITLARWATRSYHPAYARGSLFFAFFAGLSFAVAEYLGAPNPISVVGWSTVVLAASGGFLIVYALQDVVVPSKANPRAYARFRARAIAFRSLLAFIVLATSLGVGWSLVGPFGLITSGGFIWTGTALGLFHLARSARIRHCEVCEAYRNFYRVGGQWKCTTCVLTPDAPISRKDLWRPSGQQANSQLSGDCHLPLRQKAPDGRALAGPASSFFDSRRNRLDTLLAQPHVTPLAPERVARGPTSLTCLPSFLALSAQGGHNRRFPTRKRRIQ
jgi:hypothetical protein